MSIKILYSVRTVKVYRMFRKSTSAYTNHVMYLISHYPRNTAVLTRTWRRCRAGRVVTHRWSRRSANDPWTAPGTAEQDTASPTGTAPPQAGKAIHRPDRCASLKACPAAVAAARTKMDTIDLPGCGPAQARAVRNCRTSTPSTSTWTIAGGAAVTGCTPGFRSAAGNRSRRTTPPNGGRSTARPCAPS